MKIPKRVQKDAHAVILIGGLAFGKMCSDLARFIVANERGVKILVVVGEVCGSGFRRGGAVAGSVLAGIDDRQFWFARTIFQEIFQVILDGTCHPDFYPWDYCRLCRRDACFRTSHGAAASRCGQDSAVEDSTRVSRAPHLGCLYIAFAVLSRKRQVV